MKKLTCFLLGAIFLFVAASCTDTKRAKNYNEMIDPVSVSFIQQGLEAGQTQIKLSQFAAANSKNPRILSLAKSLIMDYDTTNDRLEKLAIINKVRGGDSVNAIHQKSLANIKTLSGDAFDKAYIQFVVTEHQNAIKMYTTATNDRVDAIQTFARRTLPGLRTHLDSANLICATLK